MGRTKLLWEEYGSNDAYYAVVTLDKFRKENIDDSARAEFFRMGREHVERISNELESGFGITFSPKRALDYGCGVGRVLVALAERSAHAVAVDISQSMLDEARKNCDDRGLKNVAFQDTDEFYRADAEKYDFVHSYIVLQHIDPQIGNDVIRTMLERLEPDGIGMLHVTFFDPRPAVSKLRFRMFRDMPFIHRILRRVRNRDGRIIPIFEYDLNDIFRILLSNDCHDCFVRFSDHGLIGALIFFRKAAKETY